MAVIQPTLSITSNANSASTKAGPLSFSLALSATPLSGELSVDTVEGEIFTIGTGANTELLDGSAFAGSTPTPGTNGCFIYMKNTMTSGAEVICVGLVGDGVAPTVDDDTTDLTHNDTASLRSFSLKAGEFAFFPFDYCGAVSYTHLTLPTILRV